MGWLFETDVGHHTAAPGYFQVSILTSPIRLTPYRKTSNHLISRQGYKSSAFLFYLLDVLLNIM